MVLILVATKWKSIIQIFFVSLVGIYLVLSFSWLSNSDNGFINKYSPTETKLTGANLNENSYRSNSDEENKPKNNPTIKTESVVQNDQLERLKNENYDIKDTFLLNLMK